MYSMVDFNASSIPIEVKVTANIFEKVNHFNGPYQDLVGSLLCKAY